MLAINQWRLKNRKMKICRTVILPAFCMGVRLDPSLNGGHPVVFMGHSKAKCLLPAEHNYFSLFR
jgi:hypothetical protein